MARHRPTHSAGITGPLGRERPRRFTATSRSTRQDAPRGSLRTATSSGHFDRHAEPRAHRGDYRSGVSEPAAWNDQTGNEIGDMCASTYGLPLGSTSKSNPGSTEYNQVINGDKYYTQTEFSNLAYSKYGLGKGCSQSEALAQNPKASGSRSGRGHDSRIHLLVRSPLNLPADGKSKSEIRVVEDPQAYGVLQIRCISARPSSRVRDTAVLSVPRTNPPTAEASLR